MRKLVEFFTLFGSFSTLLCCALPALLVGLGMGATFASLLSVFPQLVWVSEHKVAVFIVTGILLATSFVLRYRARNEPCPIDPKLAAACTRSRRISGVIFYVSVAIYLVGGFFAFVLPHLVR